MSPFGRYRRSPSLSDTDDPWFLADYTRQGADLFVNYDPDLMPAGCPLAGWLAAHAQPVRTSAANGCGIWSLRPR